MASRRSPSRRPRREATAGGEEGPLWRKASRGEVEAFQKRLEETVNRPATDWDDIRFTLQSEGLVEFSGDRFWRQPMGTINAAYVWARKHYARRINDQSTTSARLARLVADFMAQGKEHGLTEERFLPFRLLDKGEGGGGTDLKPAAAETLRRLIRRALVPVWVVQALLEDLDRAPASQ